MNYLDKLDPVKLALIDEVLNGERIISSVADLGACWGVDGGYCRYALEKEKVKKGVVVDQVITPDAKKWISENKNASGVTGFFGETSTIKKVGEVDLIIFFDVLLHQVKPDWNEVLNRWADQTKYVLIHNPMWTVGRETIRFIDHGSNWFKANVVFQNEERLDRWFERLDEFNKEQNCLERDVHNYWQFGISVADMVASMDELGFDCEFSKFLKVRPKKPWIKNYAFLFKKRD